MNGAPGGPLSEFDDPRELPDEELRFAQRAWDDASREYREQQDRRDRALNQLSTTRTVSWAMATVLGGAVVIAGDPLGAALAVQGVQISLAATASMLAASILLSAIPSFWPRWVLPPGFGEFVQAEATMAYVPALWRMAEMASWATRRNAASVRRLDAVVSTASALSAVSALGLLLAAALALPALL